MLSKLALAWVFMAACVVIHATGVTTALRWNRVHAGEQAYFWRRMWLFVRLAAWMIGFHMAEIAVWAVGYWWTGALADLQTSFYFSTVTYTTTGYGDVVLPVDWRLLGSIEALTGILMCGWSTGFFFAVVSRMDLMQGEFPRPRL